MRGYGRKFGGEEERWGIAGLLHDFDWEICPTPEDHPTYGAQIVESMKPSPIRSIWWLKPPLRSLQRVEIAVTAAEIDHIVHDNHQRAND